MRCIVCLTGATGIAYGLRLLEVLEGERLLIASEVAESVAEFECDVSREHLHSMADGWFDDRDLFAPVASGSYVFDAMVIVPCTESTIAKIASGVADTLITRTAAVALKEGRRLIVVPRETPVSTIMLENELRLARMGITILPASPGFYHRPDSVGDLVDFVVARILDHLGQPHELCPRWSGR